MLTVVVDDDHYRVNNSKAGEAEVVCAGKSMHKISGACSTKTEWVLGGSFSRHKKNSKSTYLLNFYGYAFYKNAAQRLLLL